MASCSVSGMFDAAAVAPTFLMASAICGPVVLNTATVCASVSPAARRSSLAALGSAGSGRMPETKVSAVPGGRVADCRIGELG